MLDCFMDEVVLALTNRFIRRVGLIFFFFFFFFFTEYLKKHQGFAGTADIGLQKAAEEKRKSHGVTTKPPKAQAFKPRPNPPNTELRRYYERGDLPITIMQ